MSGNRRIPNAYSRELPNGACIWRRRRRAGITALRRPPCERRLVHHGRDGRAGHSDVHQQWHTGRKSDTQFCRREVRARQRLGAGRRCLGNRRVALTCTALGCIYGKSAAGARGVPQLGSDADFVCPCHGSTLDLTGRVFKDKPASDNLQIPPNKFASDNVIVGGEDSKA